MRENTTDHRDGYSYKCASVGGATLRQPTQASVLGWLVYKYRKYDLVIRSIDGLNLDALG